MPVRVIRILEYEFADHEGAERHMSNWAVPANGVTQFGRSHTNRTLITIRSATTFPTFVEEALPDPDPAGSESARMRCCGVCGYTHLSGDDTQIKEEQTQ